MKKNLMMALFLLFATIAGKAQENTEKNTREERTEQKAREKVDNNLLHAIALKAILEKDFVLQADEMIATNGAKARVDEMTNFIAIRDDTATLQITPAHSVHGVTIEGKIGQWNVETDKKGITTCSLSIDNEKSTMKVTLTLSKTGNKTLATIGHCSHTESFSFGGELVAGLDAVILFGPKA